MKQFDSTKELYGVDPKVFVKMYHIDAVRLKRDSIAEKIKIIAERIHDNYKNGGKYADISADSYLLKKYRKALELVELELEEMRGAENEENN